MLGEDTERCVDQLGDHRVAEERLAHRVDVVDGLRCELGCLRSLDDHQVVSRAHATQRHIAQLVRAHRRREDVIAQPRLVAGSATSASASSGSGQDARRWP